MKVFFIICAKGCGYFKLIFYLMIELIKYINLHDLAAP